MGFLKDNPGIGIFILGLFICTIAIGASSLYGGTAIQIGDFSIEGGPEGIMSGPLFTLGVIVMVIGGYIHVRTPGRQ